MNVESEQVHRRESEMYRTYLKIKILVLNQGGVELQPAGILKYVEDLKRGSNAEFGPKDYFEMGYSQSSTKAFS